MPTEAPAAGCDAAPARRTVGSVSLVRHAAQVAWKDLRVELRSREILYTVTFFAALVVVVFSFTFPADPKLVSAVAPGMLWVALAFAGTIGLGRAFDREREGDTMRALLMAPASRLAVFLGKATVVAVLMLAVAAVVAPLLAFLMGAPFFDQPVPLILALVLGAIGFAVAGSVFAAGLLRVRARDVLLPVILYPILIPLFVAGTRTTSALLESPADLDMAWYWISFLAVFDLAFLVVSLWVFESIVIE
jgi:heme exporter protein B